MGISSRGDGARSTFADTPNTMTVASTPRVMPWGLGFGAWCLIAATLQTLVLAAVLLIFPETTKNVTDLQGYYTRVNLVMAGKIPYRQFDFEYPILALPFIVAPRLLAEGPTGYSVAFAIEMALFNAATLAIVAWKIRSEGGDVFRGIAWYSLFLLLLCPLPLLRYDLVPAFLGFAAAWLLSSGQTRSTWGGVVGGLGILTKIFPGVCVAPALLREACNLRSSRPRGMLALTAVTVIGLAAWAAIGGPGFVNALRYHTDRGIELNSIYAGLAILLDRVAGLKTGLILNYGAFHITGTWADRLKPLVFPIQVISILTVLAMSWRARFANELRYAGAALLAFSIMGKVSSPQYMLWLVPFLAATEGRAGRVARPLFAACCLATTVVYPLEFGALMNFKSRAIACLEVRTVLMLALLAWLTFGPPSSPPRPSQLRAA